MQLTLEAMKTPLGTTVTLMTV